MADETMETPREDPQAEPTTEPAAPETPKDDLSPNVVTVEDVGEATKKITVEIDRERIDAKFNEMFGELHNTAQVPGFRKGHAPRRLIEKRFGKEVGQDVRNALVSESLLAAVKDKQIQILGEPDIKLDDIELPEQGNLTFSVTIEVSPDFDLPDYKAIAVTRTSAQVTPERLDESIKAFLSNRGALVPVSGAAQAKDLVVADVSLQGSGIEPQRHEAQELRVAPGAVEGVPLEDLGEKLTGATVGQTLSVQSTVPQGHPNEAWRGQAVTVDITVKEIKRLEVPELTDKLAGVYGFESVEQFRTYVSGRLEERLAIEARQAMRDQVCKYLLEHTKLEMPAGVAARHAATVLQRRLMDLMYRGVPREQIEQNMDYLQAEASKQANVDLKLGFILDKIAELEAVTVEEGEVNARIAQMAAQQSRRPERLRSELANDGSLDQVEVQLREQKTIDKLLEMAPMSDAPAGQAPPAPPAATT